MSTSGGGRVVKAHLEQEGGGDMKPVGGYSLKNNTSK